METLVIVVGLVILLVVTYILDTSSLRQYVLPSYDIAWTICALLVIDAISIYLVIGLLTKLI